MKTLTYAMAVFAIFALLVGAYFAAYELRCVSTGGGVLSSTSEVFIVRYYRTDFEAAFFMPAAKSESLLTGQRVNPQTSFFNADYGVSS